MNGAERNGNLGEYHLAMLTSTADSLLNPGEDYGIDNNNPVHTVMLCETSLTSG